MAFIVVQRNFGGAHATEPFQRFQNDRLAGLRVGVDEVMQKLRRDAIGSFGFLAHAAARVDQLEHEHDRREDHDDARQQQIDLEAQAHAPAPMDSVRHALKSPLAANASVALRDRAYVAGCHGLCPACAAHASRLPA
ncbi:MAG: hypothetical protein ACREJT_17590, partial [Myxococcota bacterium]